MTCTIFCNILTSDRYTVLVTDLDLQAYAQMLYQITHSHYFLSKIAPKVDLQFRAVNVISSTYPNTLKDVNCLLISGIVLYPKPLSTEILSIRLQYWTLWKDVFWDYMTEAITLLA